MPLSSADLGSVLTWPVRVTPQSQATHVRADNRAPVSCPISVIIPVTFTNVPAVDDDGVGSDAGPNTTTVAFTIDGALASGGTVTFAVPCAVIATVTHASSVVAQTVALTGTDQYGRAITETLTITATGTSKTATSNQAFKTLTAATQTAAGDASTNTCKLGNSKRLGLPFKAASVNIIAEEEAGAIPATAGVIVKASTTAGADLRGTYTPDGTPDASIDWLLWYLSDDLGAITA